MVNPGEVLENYGENLINILTQNKDKNVTDVLRYSIREILRNIVEHSESDKFSFCAQYLPSKQRVNFAVLDRGIGLSKSLSNNPDRKSTRLNSSHLIITYVVIFL